MSKRSPPQARTYTCGGLEEGDAEAPEGRLHPVTDLLGSAGNGDEDEKGGEEGRSAGMTKP